MRRKGEKPLVKEPYIWSETCTIARSIRTGAGWLDAWVAQQSVILDKVGRRSGITPERLVQLLHSHEVTDQEAESLALAFRTDAGAIMASIELHCAALAERLAAKAPSMDDE